MDSNDDLTVAARVKGWDIFAPDWAYLAQHPAMQIRSLCGLSVGLHPAFADPSWVFNIAVPHFNGTGQDEYAPLEDAANGANLASQLGEFLRRVHIAVANLAPLGALTPAIGEADSIETLVRVADFATWADGMGWDLPVEFPLAQSGVDIGTRSNGNAVKVGGDGTAEETPAERRAKLDITAERGARRRILEHWDSIEKEYGPNADGRQVLRVLKRDKGEDVPVLKTVQNRLSDLRAEKLIP